MGRTSFAAGLAVLLLMVFLLIYQNSGAVETSGTEITVYKTGYCFDTIVTLTAYTSQSESEEASQILEDALLLCQEYEAKYLDRFDETSEVGAINAAQKRAISEDEITGDVTDHAVAADGRSETAMMAEYSYEVSDVCRDLTEVGLYYYELSEGTFDLTITPLSDLWNVTEEDFSLPSAEQVAEAKALVGSERVSLSGSILTLGEGQQLNFGGIAKGYMCEVLRQFFVENDLSHVIVNLGGNVFIMGSEDDYTVAIADPFSENYAATVSLREGYVVTSGIYERGQEIEGVWYHHIIDPSTGYPVDTEIVSATVVMDTSGDPDSAVAWHSDVLSTIFVLTRTQEGAKAFWQRLKAQEGYQVLSQVLLVMEDGTVIILDESSE
ncbi:MAG: FAD:protein FMN transferase [Lachnospiraceae bacterium]|nr:FAD:protein FMN transferase [Lachnospiraceae bacterium]